MVRWVYKYAVREVPLDMWVYINPHLWFGVLWVVVQNSPKIRGLDIYYNRKRYELNWRLTKISKSKNG